MATGWAGDGAVNDQIDATVKDAVERARRQLPTGPGLERCEECDAPIPPARRRASSMVSACCETKLTVTGVPWRGSARVLAEWPA